MRRRFETTKGSRLLYWEVEQHGNNITTYSGETGSAQKSHSKKLHSQARAAEEQERLISLIRRQGFEEVSALRMNAPGPGPTDEDDKHRHHWFKVMCLTGVDYFSTLGYQPGIAILAAGMISPVATLVVVLVTLFGLVPLYSRVAAASPHGQGSVAMLERLLPGWRGKALVLVLLGFAATDFVITITLSAADAAAHIINNPLHPNWLAEPITVTTLLLIALGGIFYRGFREAVGISVILVLAYITCNAIVLTTAMQQVALHPELWTNWHAKVLAQNGSLAGAIAAAALLFPKLALGMSGFETGVAVMPLVKGDSTDDEANPAGRIKNTRKLLSTAACIMAVLLMVSSIVTTLLIPEKLFLEGGEANGRALAYLAHHLLGSGFGTIYDITTILILWFAGASALAGLLTLVPRYLPRYGMAPQWAQNQKPVVVFFTAVALLVTYLFKANVDAQAGAYATGVLVLMTSAAFAVLLATNSKAPKKTTAAARAGFFAIFGVLFYTTLSNMIQRPEGLGISMIFIAVILFCSLVSRAARSLELRVRSVEMDSAARMFLDELVTTQQRICILANRPGTSLSEKEKEVRNVHLLSAEDVSFIFLEVELSDPSEFCDEKVLVRGFLENGRKVWRCSGPAVPNAIAATLLHIRDLTKSVPHVYFDWTEGHPLVYGLKYLFLGEGETAPLVREILREVDKNKDLRPKVIVG